MRGSITYEEMLRRSYAERQIMSDFIEDRLKTEGKKSNPIY
jgi:hypothetical protein